MQLLKGTLEYHCCREVSDTTAKMLFDMSIEKINCITQFGHNIVFEQLSHSRLKKADEVKSVQQNSLYWKKIKEIQVKGLKTL